MKESETTSPEGKVEMNNRKASVSKSMSEKIVRWLEKLGRSGVMLLFLVSLMAFSGCGEEKPLTPEQQSLLSAWSIRDSLEKAFKKESVDDVMTLLGPPLSTRADTRAQLERLFAMFKTVNLTLVMDSGIIDSTTRSITFMAHWTVSAIPHDKTIPHYFQTGECRLIVTLRQSPNPSKLEDLVGETFFSAPAKPGSAA